MDSITPVSSVVRMPSATLSRTAWVLAWLSLSAWLSEVIDASDRCSSADLRRSSSVCTNLSTQTETLALSTLGTIGEHEVDCAVGVCGEDLLVVARVRGDEDDRGSA